MKVKMPFVRGLFLPLVLSYALFYVVVRGLMESVKLAVANDAGLVILAIIILSIALVTCAVLLVRRRLN